MRRVRASRPTVVRAVWRQVVGSVISCTVITVVAEAAAVFFWGVMVISICAAWLDANSSWLAGKKATGQGPVAVRA